MRVAHLILAHNNPQQLERLVNRLIYAGDAVFIHLDKKTDILPFMHLKIIPGVFFIQRRIKVYWGTYSIVEATINSFEEIVNSGTEYEYINLLSGADYPVKPIGQFRDYLKANPDKVFMSFANIKEVWTEAIPRVTQYHLNGFRFPGHNLLQRLINFTMPKRVIPRNLTLVGRSQWFTASGQSVKYILDYWHQNPKLRRFLQFTWGCDEFVFQTILYNSPYHQSMVNDNLRYIDWSAGLASPRVLTVADQDAVLSSDAFFARKFDLQQPEILDLIDEQLQSLSL
jgi:hypothetical protein